MCFLYLRLKGGRELFSYLGLAVAFELQEGFFDYQKRSSIGYNSSATHY